MKNKINDVESINKKIKKLIDRYQKLEDGWTHQRDNYIMRAQNKIEFEVDAWNRKLKEIKLKKGENNYER